MKFLIVLLGLCVIAATAYGQTMTKKICACPKILWSVCGDDGKTYDNKCLLECQKTVKLVHDGKCTGDEPKQEPFVEAYIDKFLLLKKMK